METKEVHEKGFVRPLLSADSAVEAFNEYQALKIKLRGDGDFITFYDRDGNKKEAPTKSWRSKLTRFFGISVEIVSEKMDTLPDGSFLFTAVAKAIATNGLFMFGDGSCWSKTKNEKDRKGNPVDIYHNTRSHAITRAKNRAVLELVGFGEVSAEEISGELETPNLNGNGKKAIDSKPLPTITEKQVKLVFARGNEKGLTSEETKEKVTEWTGVPDIADLNYQQLNVVLEELQKLEKK